MPNGLPAEPKYGEAVAVAVWFSACRVSCHSLTRSCRRAAHAGIRAVEMMAVEAQWKCNYCTMRALKTWAALTTRGLALSKVL